MSRSRSGSREDLDRMVTMDETREDDGDRAGDDGDHSVGKDRKRRYSSGKDSSRGRGSRSKSKSRSRSPTEKRSRSRSRSPRRYRRSYSRSRSRSRSRSPRRGGDRDRDRGFEDTRDDDGYRLHVADLDSQANKRDLEKLFGKHREDAEEAQRKVDGAEVCSRRIRVTIAKPRTRGRGRRGFDPGMRCYQCGERGHFSRDCSDTKFGYRRPPSPRRGGRDDRRDYNRRDDRRDFNRRDDRRDRY